MSDRILEVVVVLLPTLFAVGIEVVSKDLRERRLWRVAVLVFGIVTSLSLGYRCPVPTRLTDASRRS